MPPNKKELLKVAQSIKNHPIESISLVLSFVALYISIFG